MVEIDRSRVARIGPARPWGVPAGALLALTLHASMAAAAMPAPTPNALFQFQTANRRHPWLRIRVDSETVERRVSSLDPIGLHDLSTTDGERLAGPLEWRRISRIDEVVTRATPWRRAGAVTLGLLGAGLGNALGAPHELGGRMALAGLIVFGGAGGWLGDRYGSHFRSERNWYVADTAGAREPTERTAAPAALATPSEDPAVLRACVRIGNNERFRAHGSFGSFQGHAETAGPAGLEALRADPRARRRDTDPSPPRNLSWDQIDRVEMRGGSALNGALVMGAAFGAAGALLGFLAVELNSGAEITPAEGAGLGALYVAPVGVVLGGLGGMATRRWVEVYRRH